MKHAETIRLIENLVKNAPSFHDSGHDWWHIDRVRRTALLIINEELQGDHLITEASALLHEVFDDKFSGPEQEDLKVKADKLLSESGLSKSAIDEIQFIIQNISFRKGFKATLATPEFAAVQDADRLDALGAIGIARAFNYGGYAGKPLFDPAPGSKSTIAHFHDKLLKLKDMMNTRTGRELAEERNDFMVEYLKRFSDEWEGIKKLPASEAMDF